MIGFSVSARANYYRYTEPQTQTYGKRESQKVAQMALADLIRERKPATYLVKLTNREARQMRMRCMRRRC